MRLYLAFVCFFRVLFGKPLPVGLFPAPASPPPAPAELPAQVSVTPVPTPPVPSPAPQAPAPTPERAVSRTSDDVPVTAGALQLLSMFQREGRLLDFLSESLDGYSDADIGVAVRDIHRGCRKVLTDHFPLERILPEAEESKVTVDEDFDRHAIRLVGRIGGAPPFQGVLRHHGWRVAKPQLPRLGQGLDPKVVAPAEVELS